MGGLNYRFNFARLACIGLKDCYTILPFQKPTISIIQMYKRLERTTEEDLAHILTGLVFRCAEFAANAKQSR